MAERVYVALDLETTGLDAGRDAIIEIGAIKFSGDRIIERFATLVNPQRAIPPRITQITGIRDADVAGAPTLDRVLPEVLAFVGSEVGAVIAHNTDFDLGFLRAAGINFRRPAYDTVELAMILLPGAASYNLGELCLRFGIPLVDAHRAPDDAEATGHLFRVLHERMLALPPAIVRLIADSAAESAWPLTGFFADGAALLAGTTAEAAAPAFQPAALAPHEPATAAGDYTAVAPAIVEEIFAEGGPLHALLGPTFERRSGQVAMAQQVTQALNEGDHLLVEAGTGTGKSLAYLLPAALWAMANDDRVVVATNTLNLQDQLLEKDIPQVATLLGERGLPPLRAALLKGRQHYICTRRFHEWRSSHRLSPDELTVLAKVLVWLPTTLTGESAELALFNSNEQAIWRRFGSDGSACSIERCGRPLGAAYGLPDGDFYLEAKRRAEAAHVVVVNHALLLADLAAEGRVLPAYSHLVVDEAHRLEEAATDQLTYRVEWTEVSAAISRVAAEGDLTALMHRRAADERLQALLEAVPVLATQARRTSQRLGTFADLLANFARSHSEFRSDGGYVQRLALDSKVRSQPLWSEVEIEWDRAGQALHALVEALAGVTALMERARWDEDERTLSLVAECRGITSYLAELAKRLDEIVPAPHGNRRDVVAWMEVGDNAALVTLALAPLSVQGMVEQGLVLARRSAIFTGATLRTGSGFNYLRDRLGLWDVKVSTVESPFDYKRNVLLYMPSDMPLPNDGRYQQFVEQAVADAAVACQGRTLALFTSFQQVRATAEAIRTPLERLGVTVLQHGQSSRSRLLREFRANEQAVLLGTRSFWEGVDLPGDEVRCLLIARLPFAVPSEPLVAARSAEFDDPFNDYTVPDAVLRFRQGFGRLIRRAGDRGVVVLLDSRVWRKQYGQAFLDALPDCTTRRAPLSNLASAVEKWFNQ